MTQLLYLAAIAIAIADAPKAFATAPGNYPQAVHAQVIYPASQPTGPDQVNIVWNDADSMYHAQLPGGELTATVNGDQLIVQQGSETPTTAPCSVITSGTPLSLQTATIYPQSISWMGTDNVRCAETFLIGGSCAGLFDFSWALLAMVLRPIKGAFGDFFSV